MNGQTNIEATGFRFRYGLNDIPEEKKNPPLKSLSYFWGPIP
jgi:H+-transporting ATPase